MTDLQDGHEIRERERDRDLRTLGYHAHPQHRAGVRLRGVARLVRAGGVEARRAQMVVPRVHALGGLAEQRDDLRRREQLRCALRRLREGPVPGQTVSNHVESSYCLFLSSLLPYSCSMFFELVVYPLLGPLGVDFGPPR